MYSILVVLVSFLAHITIPNHLMAFIRKRAYFVLIIGTGKSVLLREIIKTLRKKYVSAPDAVAITASTGLLSF